MANNGGSWWGDMDPLAKFLIIVVICAALFFGCVFSTGGFDAPVRFR